MTSLISALVVNVPATIEGHTVEIKALNGRFGGFVDNSNFGEGKTRKAAETAIKKRLAYLAQAPQSHPCSAAELEAKMMLRELADRKAAESWKKLVY